MTYKLCMETSPYCEHLATYEQNYPHFAVAYTCGSYCTNSKSMFPTIKK